ncbi:MAG: amidophosphoribosyltransferase [Acidobacteria bacterium]|nr:amidophosphoribosyltransferase [Acidobacteriota bacterium]
MCGVAGVFGIEGASSHVASILFAIQHRGQESCGAVARDARGRMHGHKGMGLVKQVLNEDVQARLSGSTSIGHVRYPTAGCSDELNSQPHIIELDHGPIMAIASNGDLINYGELRQRLEGDGVVFKSDNDAELIGRIIALYHVRDGLSMEEAIARTQRELKGAFSTVVMYRDLLYAFRDPHGFRPLVMGHIPRTGSGEPTSEGTVFASESCGLGIIGARLLREVKPGEILRLEAGKPVVSVSHAPLEPKHCVFELIYFSRPDSQEFGETVYQTRERIGACLAAKDDHLPNGEDLVVMPVPDSSNFIALGYAKAKEAEFGMGLLRNHYVGRTFIKPTQASRDEGVKQKFNPLPDFFPGKRVVLIDDSIVRGTSLKKIVSMVRGAGAKEIHLRIGSPKVIGPCYYGIDTPTRDELIANRMTGEEIRAYLGADSLEWLEVGDFEGLLPGRRKDFCTACFDLDYIYPPEGFAEKTNVPSARAEEAIP